MITILPMEDGVRKQEILHRFPSISGSKDVIVMREQEEEFGTAVLSIEDGVLKILDITVNGQRLSELDPMGKMVADSLMRSAASYGETYGAVEIAAYLPELESFLESKGFRKAEGKMVTPMQTIVHRTKPKR